jgi:hypothetical protein
MTPTSFIPSRRVRGFFAATFAALLTLGTASATSRYYRATWSGAALGNGASATANVVINDPFLANPGDSSNTMGSGAVEGFFIQVTGAGGGDGSWATANYSSYTLTISNALVLGANWVGQPQPATGGNWGQSGSQNFNVVTNTAGAPTASPFGPFVLRTGNGLDMGLTAFVPAYDLHTGTPVSNLSGVTVKKLYPTVAAPDGTLFARAKIAGMGVTGVNDDVVLRSIGASGFADILFGEGSGINGGTIAKFGDPLFESVSGRVYCSAALVQTGGVTALNDAVLVACQPVFGYLAQFAREGDPAPGAGTRVFTKFTWMHPVHAGVFFGAKAGDPAATPPVLAGAWFWDGATVSKVVLPGDATSLDGSPRTVKSVTLPTAAAPVNYQTRVGDGTSVSLLLKTLEGEDLVKRFGAP